MGRNWFSIKPLQAYYGRFRKYSNRPQPTGSKGRWVGQLDFILYFLKKLQI